MGEYQAGECNIGPAEIARRRRAGDVGTIVTVVLAAALVMTRAPRPWRLVLAMPAAGAASGYLQARAKFCAGFGSRGVYNFGPVGGELPVEDPEARALDLARSRRIGAASAAIGIAAALAATALPRLPRG